MDLDFDDVRVDSDQLLGAPGKGFRLARRALEGGRVAIAAQALGVGQAALDEALAYAKSRHTFGQPIGNYQAIQWMLADMATELDAARMLTLRAADARAAAGARARRGGDGQAVRLGGRAPRRRQGDADSRLRGYRRGSRVERLFRDVRAHRDYQGTSEVQRMIIAAHVLEGRESHAKDQGPRTKGQGTPNSQLPSRPRRRRPCWALGVGSALALGPWNLELDRVAPRDVLPS